MSKKQIKKLPPAAYLNECLLYNKTTGVLTWKKRPLTHFVSKRSCSTWNARYAGKKAFSTLGVNGFFSSINNQKFLAHRIIWKMMTGSDPVALIDHKDRDNSNNKWHNLRDATKSQNNINSLVKRGVSFDKTRNKWQSYIKKDGKRMALGRYDTEQEALAVRANAARKLFGEFAP